MAITVTSRGTVSKVNPPEVLTVTSGAFSATASRLIGVVLTGFQGYTSSAAFTDSDTIADTGGGAWVEDCFSVNTAAEGLVRFSHRQLGSAPGASKTVTTTNTGPHHDVWLQSVLEIAGHNTTTPVPTGQKATATSTASSITVSLPNPPDSNSLVVCALCSPGLGAGVATPSGFTVITSQALTGDGHGQFYKIGSGPQSVTWTSLVPTTGGFLHEAFIVEIQQPGTITVPTFGITDSFGDIGGGLWTKGIGVSASGAEAAIWYRRIGTSSVSGTVVATALTSSPGRSMSVLELAGRNTLAPIPTGQAVAASTTNTTVVAAFPTTPSVDSIVVAGEFSRAGTSAPGVPTGHVTVTNNAQGGDAYEVGYMPGGAPASATWSGLTNTRNLAVASEFRVLGSGGGGGGTGGGGGGGGGTGGGSQFFTATSTWNTPIASNATFTDEPALRGSYGWIETQTYGAPIVISNAADPLVSVTINEVIRQGASWGWTDNPVSVRIPAGITGASGTDGALGVVGADGIEWDFWQFVRDSTNTAHCESSAHTSTITGDGWGRFVNGIATGAGIHAAGSSLVAGDIRGNELTAGIHHTLAIACNYLNVQPWPNYVGQAISADGPPGGGPLTEGSRVAIPPGVAMPNGLNLQEQNMWIACQTYGCFIIDVSGGNASIQWWGDALSVPQADVDALLHPPNFNTVGLTAIVNALRIVH